MLTLERKYALLLHAQKSLAKWQARPEYLKSPSDGPPANLIGCEEVIALMQELLPDTGEVHKLNIDGLEVYITEYELGQINVPAPEIAHSSLVGHHGEFWNDSQINPGLEEINAALKFTGPPSDAPDRVDFVWNGLGEMPDNLTIIPAPKKPRGRQKGSKNKPKQPAPVKAAAKEDKPVREFKPFGTHDRTGEQIA